jgi:hypothetical protein
VLEQFDRLYVLAQGGNCVYDGPTDQLLYRLRSIGLQCAPYFNPADLLLQLASGELGMQRVHQLTATHRLNSIAHVQQTLVTYPHLIVRRDLSRPHHKANATSSPTTPMSRNDHGLSSNWWSQFYLLIARSARCSTRRPTLTLLRTAYFALFALFIYYTYNYPIGRFEGCAAQSTGDIPSDAPPLDYAQASARLADNASLLFFVCMFLVISSVLPAALAFPLEFAQFARERANGWYRASTYFAAKWTADLPAYVCFPLLFVALFYPLTGQPMELWRFLLFCAIVVLNSLISRSFGLLVGAIFVRDSLTAVFVSTCAVFPFMLASGFLVRPSVSTWLLRPFWHVSFVRYTFACLLVTVYGFGRCSRNATSALPVEGTSPDSIGQWNNAVSAGALQSLLGSYLRPPELSCVSRLTARPDGVALVDQLLSECRIGAEQFLGQPALSDLSRYDNSFILSYFEIRNEDFNSYLLRLLFTLALLTGLNYCALVYRVRRNTRF